MAGALLWAGRYPLLERVLVWCVALMGLLFVLTAVLVQPDVGELLSGVFKPRMPAGGAVVVLALIGTTMVPYNLFLHARVIQARWRGAADLPAARRDLIFAIGLGGVVSAAIVVTASATLQGTRVESAVDMAHQLAPILGDWARVIFGLGIAVAGITSAITAPLAAAYIVAGLVGEADLDSRLMRWVALGCVGVGAGLALTGVQPIRLIVVAQAANGIVLPLVVCAMVVVLNDRNRLGRYANGLSMNALALGITLVCVLMAVRNYLPFG